MNDRGEVAGSKGDHAFLYTGGRVVDLGTLGGARSQAWGINSQSQVVGEASLKDNSCHAFVYQNNKMEDLGTLGGSDSCAFGINDKDHIVGHSARPAHEEFHGFLWKDGKMSDLGVLAGRYSEATAINSSEEIVGYSYVGPGDYDAHAVLWKNGRIWDLNRLIPGGTGWTLERATGINGQGQIVVFGHIQGHPSSDGFLLTPNRSQVGSKGPSIVSGRIVL